MVDTNKILSFIERVGPTLPAKVAKDSGISLLFASAAMSELSSKNKVKVSHLKIGGSPLYFVPGHESRLQDFVSHMNPKDKIAYDLLQKEQVLHDPGLEPLIRVSLRNIKDFAKPVYVDVNGQREVFWKWYLLSNEDASSIVKKILKMPADITPASTQETQIKKEVTTKRTSIEKLPASQQERPLHPKVSSPRPTPVKQDQQSSVKSISPPKSISKESPGSVSTQDILKDDSLKEFYLTLATDPFLKQANSFFEKNKIAVISFSIKKKKTDYEFILNIPSAVGNIRYYCNAKDKKRINEGDLSTALVQGMVKKLPILFLTPGSVVKKLEEKLDKEFKDIIIRNI